MRPFASGAAKALWTGRGLFETHELATIGLFAAAARTAGLFAALAGGGMNPLAMALRGAVHSALMVILLHKVPRPGALTLATLVGGLISLFLLGQAMMSLPAAILSAAAAEGAVLAMGGLGRRPWLAAAAVAGSELLARLANLVLAALLVRGTPGLLLMIGAVTAFGYLGVLAGAVAGERMAKELTRAGLIRR